MNICDDPTLNPSPKRSEFHPLPLMGMGVVHSLGACRSLEDPAALPILVFGIFYFITGIFLAINLRLAPLLGVIFPLIGLAAGFIVIGVSNWTVILTMLFLADALVIGCCIPFLIPGKGFKKGGLPYTWPDSG